MKKYLVLIVGLFVTTSTFTQIEGEQLFGETQVAIIELEFSQDGWWDSLVTNYETATWMEADVTITDATGVSEFPSVAVRLKGNSSYFHPGDKKSFKIDFNKYVSGQNYDGLKKLNFSNNFKDPSFMRDKIYFDMCRDINLPAPRVNYADVFMNGTHWGFYTVIEQIDDQFLDWNMEDDAGNLFKAGDAFDGPDGEGNLVDYGAEQSAYEERYELKTNEDENDWTDLVEFINFINNSSDAEFENELDQWIETDQFLRSMAMDNLFSNLDAYINSSRNYYLYHNTTTGLWNWIKWDCNEAFGTYTGGMGPGSGLSMIELDIYYVNTSRPLLERVHEIPGLQERYDEQFCVVYTELFSADLVQAYIDENYTLIQPYVLADDNKMYTNSEFEDNLNEDITSGGGPGGGTIYGLTSFVEAKADFVSGEIDCSGVTSIIHQEISEFALYPNPANTLVYIEGDAGEQVIFYSINGSIILRDNCGWVDIEQVPAGMYIVQTIINQTVQRASLIIE